jgi:phenylacetic acid degradation operon negative regulatory protein
MPSDPVSTLVDRYAGLRDQRVWSLLVSVFGDLAQSEGSEIDGPVLSAILGAMKVKPEAARVALHRLRKDGWIQSRRTGRIRRHSLSPRARRDSLAASRRIYAPPEAMPTNWQVIVLEDEALPTGFVRIADRVYLGADTLKPPETALLLGGAQVPTWLRSALTIEPLKQQYQALNRVLAETQNTIECADLDPLDRAVLRCLIVHNWRRLVLKHVDLPRDLYSDDWLEHDCRARVTDLLARIERPDLSEITAA